MSEVVCRLDEIPTGSARRFVVDGVPVAVVRIGDEVYAIGDVCSHANVSLSDGEVWEDSCALECPKHGSSFSLPPGEPDPRPATRPGAVHSARVDAGDVVVEVSS